MFEFESLRRFPDVEAPNLFASDAADRLIIDEAGPALLERHRVPSSSSATTTERSPSVLPRSTR